MWSKLTSSEQLALKVMTAIAGILFFLKLLGVPLSWWMVLAPFWLPVLIFVAIYAAFYLFMWRAERSTRYEKRRRSNSRDDEEKR